MAAQEAFDLTIDAFNLAEIYRIPVLVMMDECVGHMTEKVVIPEADAIEIIWDRGIDPHTEKKKKNIDKFIYHLSMCTMCGLCIEACPTDAIVWAQNFENSVYDRSQLTKVLNKPGSRLKAGVED